MYGFIYVRVFLFVFFNHPLTTSALHVLWRRRRQCFTPSISVELKVFDEHFAALTLVGSTVCNFKMTERL